MKDIKLNNFCTFCTRSFFVHTKLEILECCTAIIIGVKGLPKREKNSTCYSCKRELSMHTDDELLECSLKIIQSVKDLDSNRNNKE
jgi:hypothetical protein